MSNNQNDPNLSQFTHQLQSLLGAAFHCNGIDGGRVKIRTPFLCPDGTFIDVVWQNDDDEPTVSDAGETLGWMYVTGRIADDSDPVFNEGYDAACETYGLEKRGSTLFCRVTDSGDLALAVVNLCQAIVALTFWSDNKPPPDLICRHLMCSKCGF